VRVVAFQAFSLGNRIMQELLGVYRPVAAAAQDGIILLDTELMLRSRKGCVAHGALPYDKRTVEILVIFDVSVALGGHATPERVRMRFLFGTFRPACISRNPEQGTP